MIKLKQPFNYKGLFHEAGTVLPVDNELEKKMVDSGFAEYLLSDAEKQVEENRPIASEKTETASEPETSSKDTRPRNKNK